MPLAQWPSSSSFGRRQSEDARTGSMMANTWMNVNNDQRQDKCLPCRLPSPTLAWHVTNSICLLLINWLPACLLAIGQVDIDWLTGWPAVCLAHSPNCTHQHMANLGTLHAFFRALSRPILLWSPFGLTSESTVIARATGSIWSVLLNRKQQN